MTAGNRDAERLDEVIAGYLQAEARGEQPDRGQLLERHPKLADALGEFFASHDRMRRAAEAARPPEGTAGAGGFADTLDSDAGRAQRRNSTVPVAGERLRYFGDYELLREIARGGMGIVYKARQTTLGRVVALKMIADGQFASEADVRRFQLEAEAAAALDHPNIVPIFEVGQHRGRQYFSMGFVHGGSLAERLAAGPLPPREAAQLIAAVARAVQYAHDHGVIHRDLKPGNILLDKEGQPRVTDFGLAKRVRGGEDLTTTGQILGTPAYMSPEQAAGQVRYVRATTDIYALGAVLYATLTGRPPFQADNPLDTMMQVIEREAVPPRQLNSGVPVDLETICLKCLEKNRHGRYESAGELADDLDRFLAGQPVVARPVGSAARLWRWCKRRPTVAALLGLLCASLVGGTAISSYFAVRAGSEAEEAKQQRIAARRSATEATLNRALEICQRGEANAGLLWLSRALQTAAAEDGDMEQAIRANLGAWSAQCPPLTSLQRVSGRVVAISRYGAVVLTAHERGEETIGQVARCSDGRTIGESFRLGRQSAVAEIEKQITIATGPIDETIHVRSIRDGVASTRVLACGATVVQLVLSPDGRDVFALAESNGVWHWDLLEEPPVATELVHDEGLNVRDVGISGPARQVAMIGDDGTIKLWSFGEDGWEAADFARSDHPHGPVLSPDGQLLAFRSDGGIRVLDIESGQTLGQPAAQGRETFSSMSFSPDSQALVVRHEGRLINALDARTGRLRFSLPLQPAGVFSYRVSPDSRFLLVAESQSAFTSLAGRLRLYSMRNGQPASPLMLLGSIRGAAFSADGTRMIAADTHEMNAADATLRIWDLGEHLRDRAPLATFEHPGWVFSAAFSPDGNALLIGGTDGAARLWDVATETPIAPPLVHGKQRLINDVSFHPQGHVALTAGHDRTVRRWDARTGRPVGQVLQHPRSPGSLAMVWSAAFSPDGRLIVTGTGSGGVLGKGDTSLRFWDASSGKQLGAKIDLPGGVRALRFFPDGDRLVSACMDGSVQIWDTATREPVGRAMRHRADARGVAVGPGGSRILSGGEDGMGRIWDAATQQPLVPALEHGAPVASVAFSPDGRLAVTGGHDGQIRFWDAATGLNVGRPLRQGGQVLSVEFGPNGRKLVAGSSDRRARVWRVPQPVSATPEEVELWVQVITGLALDEGGAVRPLAAAEWAERRDQWSRLLGGGGNP